MPDANQPLVSPEWLAQHLADPDLAILDVRIVAGEDGRAAFAAGHIPGAVFTDYAKDGWRAAKGIAVGMLPDEAALSGLFGRLGLTPEQQVVVVPTGINTGDFSAAARVYWTLKAAGHRRLSLLDGGWEGWRAAGRPVETGPGRARPATQYPVRIDAGLRAEVGRVEAAVARRDATLLDARGRGYFEGREKSPQAMRAGRLPGAAHLDQGQAYDASRHGLKPREELDRLYAAVPEGEVISFCNTGQAAATNWFVLAELLGRRDVRLYDGSMSEWTQDERRPVETGPG
ncbi:MAG TPA: sulfurtransferase [Beijerinckiaceae bacterium]|jgi:thiosulfate/3-mercaptopyruvate sulfurtransferase